MRAIAVVGLGLLAVLPRLALAASTIAVASERALREECSAFAQAGMRDCLAKKAGESQASLQQAEKDAATTPSKWDEDDKYVIDAKTKLTRSNKEFEKYRQSQCDFLSSLVGGGAGNAHEIDRLACLAELNNRRAKQLRDAVSTLPSK